MSSTILPTDPAARKNIPLASGLLDYFPAALAEVAYVSFVGNEKHNPGQELHHARGKSMDHADCIARHLTERGTIDTVQLKDGREFKVRHSAYVAWRALALLQEELEAAGAPLARGARLPAANDAEQPPLYDTDKPVRSGCGCEQGTETLPPYFCAEHNKPAAYGPRPLFGSTTPRPPTFPSKCWCGNSLCPTTGAHL